MTANPIPEAVLEAVARAICVACEDNPDSKGDARGNEFRWQDYRDTALAAISAFTAAQQQGQAVDQEPVVDWTSLTAAQKEAWGWKMFQEAAQGRLAPRMRTPPSAPVEVEELVERMRQAPSRLWMADLVGQKISVERMRDILTFALAQQQESNNELA